jgi:CAAX protease family protein
MHELQPESPASRPLTGAAIAPWWHTGLLVALLAGGSLLSGRQVHRAAFGGHHVARYGVAILSELVLLLLAWWGLRMRGIPIAEVLQFHRGWRAWAEDLVAAAVFWITSATILIVIGLALRAAHLATPEKTVMALAPRTGLELLLWIALSITAGFCEEFVFRGYFLRQFSSLGGGVGLGVLVSSLLFGLSHGYEGAAGMIAITVYGALFCALVFLRRSLRPGMMAHAWQDIFSGVMLVVLRHVHPL